MKFTYKEERSPQQRNAARGQRRNEEFDDHDRGRGQRRAGPPPPDEDMDDDIPF